MTLDYTKMFLIVTEEAVVKGHFTSAWADSQCVPGAVLIVPSLPRSVTLRGHMTWRLSFVSAWADSQCATNASIFRHAR